MPPGPPGPAAPIGVRPVRRRAALGLAVVLLIGPVGAWSFLRDPGTRPAAPTPVVVSSDPVPPDQEARGKRLYEEGVGRSGRPVLALLNDGVAAPAAVLRCVNCHGEDGRGTVEGGSTPPDITWATLTRPITRPAGGDRPPYTEALVRRALGAGLDPRGRPLSAPMPRYRMSMEDLDDLLAYLKRLGQAPAVPGITPDRVRLGILLPPTRDEPGPNRAVRSALESWADRINRDGLYGRRVECAFLDLDDEPGRRAAQVDQFLRASEPFALVGADLSGAEMELAGRFEARRVPVVGALTDLPPVTSPPARYIFYLDGGMRSEALAALTDDEGRVQPGRRLAVLYADDPRIERLAGEVAARGRAGGLELEGPTSLPPGDQPDRHRALAGRLAGRDVEMLCLLGPPGRWLPLLTAADRLGWRPRVVVPGSLATPRVFEIPEAFDDRLVLAFATGSGPGPRAERLAGAAAALLAEALRRAGRDVTRESLVATLEQFQDVPTGILPPVSFGPNRRIGAPGAFLARLRRASHTVVAGARRPVTEE